VLGVAVEVAVGVVPVGVVVDVAVGVVPVGVVVGVVPVGVEIGVAVGVGVAVDVAVGVAVDVAVGVAVDVAVDVEVGVAVGVEVGVGVTPLAHGDRVIVLVSNVTAPLRAYRLPLDTAPVVKEMEVSARMFPIKLVFVPTVAELPTCQKILHA